MRFTKMHGLGNDFIVSDGKELAGKNLQEISRSLCNRHLGIGADGLLLYYQSELCDIGMKLYNSDGSEADMCGNGLRCLAKYAFERKLVTSESFLVHTKAGIMKVKVFTKSSLVENVEVNMGPPRILRKEIPVVGNGESTFIEEPLEIGEKSYRATCVNVGNTHCVIFVNSFEGLSLEEEGMALENHHLFPMKTNVEFVKIESPELLLVRVWERGAGATLACGTGACASVVAAHLSGKAQRTATVVLPGGNLQVNWSDSGDLYMRGPASEVFIGEVVL